MLTGPAFFVCVRLKNYRARLFCNWNPLAVWHFSCCVEPKTRPRFVSWPSLLVVVLLFGAQKQDSFCLLLSCWLEPKNKAHFVSSSSVPGCLLFGAKKRLILSRGPLYQGQLPPLLEASSPGCCLVCFKGQYALYFFKTQKKPILEPIRVSTKNDPSWAQKKKERDWRDWLPM